MISIETIITSPVKLTDRPAVSLCTLGAPSRGTGLSGIRAARLASSLLSADLPVRERNERPTKALAAVEAQAQGAYAFSAAGAGFRNETQHHQMWAFRGPEPWSDPA
ncbi:hypothetical protein ACIG53_07450 [Streptomyces bauhiniae]|uniref:hypothetical protein n=1 Tax=Streptomyces bauhiniae TaxID=2340725 RepID=UPI0037D1C48A